MEKKTFLFLVRQLAAEAKWGTALGAVRPCLSRRSFFDALLDACVLSFGARLVATRNAREHTHLTNTRCLSGSLRVWTRSLDTTLWRDAGAKSSRADMIPQSLFSYSFDAQSVASRESRGGLHGRGAYGGVPALHPKTCISRDLREIDGRASRKRRLSCFRP